MLAEEVSALSRAAVEEAPAVDSERAARRTLRTQIARLEGDLAAVYGEERRRILPVSGQHGGARLLSLEELEQVRDALAGRLSAVRAEAAQDAERHQSYRTLIEQMLLEPARYKWVRVTAQHIGETGCKTWHVRPRLGPVGLICGWWRVKISSGCPLPTVRAVILP